MQSVERLFGSIQGINGAYAQHDIIILKGIRPMRIGVTVLLGISVVLGIPLITYSYKRRSQPGVRYFIWLAVTIMIVNGGYIGELSSGTMSAALFWSGVEHLALPLNPYFWLMMCLDYTQSKHKKVVRNILLIFPAFYYFAFYTNSALHLYITKYYFVSNGYFPVLVSDKGPAFLIILAAITVIGIACMALYIKGYLQSARMYRTSYLLMILASALPWVSIYFNVHNSTFLRIDYYSPMMVVTAVLYLLGLFHYNIFSTMPIATETVYRLSEDAIALINSGGIITDVNESFLRQYPEMNRLTAKSTVNDFLARHSELCGLSPENPEMRFHTAADGGERYYSEKLTGIFSGNGIHVGDILQIKDITVFMEYQNQLKELAAKAMERADTNELSFLQAQISPHFINNTLSAICSLITRDDEAAKDLVVNLSEYLISCYRIGNSSPMETLAHELEAADTYMRIVKARFGNRIRYISDIKISSELTLPRLVLQPLVENAVRHGVQPKKDGGTVRLSAAEKGGYACFEVSDDGVGIEPERIQTLLSGKDDKQGVGMINIHRRLIKYYGEGLRLQSGNGTTVTFRIPLQNTGKEAFK